MVFAYHGSVWHKEIVRLKVHYQEYWSFGRLNLDFYKKYKPKDELILEYNKCNKVSIKIIKEIEHINKLFEEVEKERNVKLRNHVKSLLNLINNDFNKLKNDIEKNIIDAKNFI